jgi:hypothetical protein
MRLRSDAMHDLTGRPCECMRKRVCVSARSLRSARVRAWCVLAQYVCGAGFSAVLWLPDVVTAGGDDCASRFRGDAASMRCEQYSD